jgi:phosphoribosyl 1,2-cyclic phosphodiesterase
VGDAVKLAENARVRRLFLFHHAPERSDGAVEDILREVWRELKERGSTLRVEAAEEGAPIFLGGGGA